MKYLQRIARGDGHVGRVFFYNPNVNLSNPLVRQAICPRISPQTAKAGLGINRMLDFVGKTSPRILYVPPEGLPETMREQFLNAGHSFASRFLGIKYVGFADGVYMPGKGTARDVYKWKMGFIADVEGDIAARKYFSPLHPRISEKIIMISAKSEDSEMIWDDALIGPMVGLLGRVDCREKLKEQSRRSNALSERSVEYHALRFRTLFLESKLENVKGHVASALSEVSFRCFKGKKRKDVNPVIRRLLASEKIEVHELQEIIDGFIYKGFLRESSPEAHSLFFSMRVIEIMIRTIKEIEDEREALAGKISNIELNILSQIR